MLNITNILSSFVGSSIELGKIFTFDYWNEASKTVYLSPIDNTSPHYYVWFVVIALMICVSFGFSFYKSLFLDHDTLDKIDSVTDAYQIKNPVYNKLSFFETWFRVSAILLYLFFVFRQLNIHILSTRWVVLGIIIYTITGIVWASYYLTKQFALDKIYFNQVTKK